MVDRADTDSWAVEPPFELLKSTEVRSHVFLPSTRYNHFTPLTLHLEHVGCNTRLVI